MKKLDITGQKFGYWTALKRVGSYTVKRGGYSLWSCQCECGLIKNVSLSALKNGITTSCGCKRSLNQKQKYSNTDPIPGEKYNDLIIISRVNNSYSKSGRVNKKFLVQCNCGNRFITMKQTLVKNKTLACSSCARLKAAKKLNSTQVAFHWKTLEEIHCVGSYEYKVIEYLNKQQIDYIWKYKTFLLPSGKRYTPDLFLVSKSCYVEIKGFWWNSKSYYDEFIMTNQGLIELWNKPKLKLMKILD